MDAHLYRKEWSASHYLAEENFYHVVKSLHRCEVQWRLLLLIHRAPHLHPASAASAHERKINLGRLVRIHLQERAKVVQEDLQKFVSYGQGNQDTAHLLYAFDLAQGSRRLCHPLAACHVQGVETISICDARRPVSPEAHEQLHELLVA
jgi:hypothetical protein